MSESGKVRAKEALKSAFELFDGKLNNDPDMNFLLSVPKFSERIYGMSSPNLTTALHKFGSVNPSYSLNISKGNDFTG